MLQDLAALSEKFPEQHPDLIQYRQALIDISHKLCPYTFYKANQNIMT